MALDRYSNYPNGFPKGLELRGVPLHSVAPGNVFWVGNNTPGVGASNLGTFGKSRNRPFSTVDYAVGNCTADNTDVIFVLPGHAETLTADSAVDIDVAGVLVICLGTGEKRATFTFTTDTDADFKLAAANTGIFNAIFKCNIASQVMMIETSGKDFAIVGCDFREGTQTPLNCITVGVADNDSDRGYIKGNKFYVPTAGNGDSAISFAKDHIGVSVEDNDIYGDFDLAGIDIPAGGNAQVDCTIEGGKITNLQSGQHAIQVNGSSSTGTISDVYAITDAITTSVDAGGLEMFQVYHNDGTDQAGWSPIVVQPDSAANILGADDNDNGFSSTNVVANKDGSILERLEQIMEAVNPDSGTSLAANNSLADILYATNGIAGFPTAAIPADGVSIAEVLRESYEQQEKSISSNNPVVMVNADTVFTVTGGPIEILALVSECITLNDATASTLQYSADPTVGAATTFSGASASLANAAAGSGVVLNGLTLATAPDLIDPLVGLTGDHNRGVIVGAGIITLVIGVGSTTGTWRHYIRYRPLARGVTVTAAT